MVGNLEDPLNFDPHLISVNKILDPEGDDLYDVDFGNWDTGGITVKISGGAETGTAKLSFDDLKNAAQKQNKSSY